MKKFVISSILFTIAIGVVLCQQYKKTNFCQDESCLTCVGKYCTRTCKGATCKECPLGDCCDGNSCNICRGSRCCATTQCNSCIQECLKTCQTESTCHFDCFERCIPEGISDDKISQKPKVHIFSNRQYLPVNVTTLINITNTIRSENVVHNPVLVNTTNINTQNATKNVVVNAVNKFCCTVVHPEACKVGTYNDKERKICFTGRHSECSPLCTSTHIHIVKSETENDDCIPIAIKPFRFCKNFEALDCSGCYCNMGTCAYSATCPDRCKPSLLDDHSYNIYYVYSLDTYPEH